MKRNISLVLALAALLMASFAHADGWSPGSRASNIGSIVNTRHNMTQSFMGYDPNTWPYELANIMNGHRINFLEVCVYCHTPHGANTTIAAPLWNRTNKNNTYTLYNIPLTSGQSPTNPGVNSLVCLSCHDGSTAIDSVINMPGSGKYSAAQQTSQNNAFLNTWNGQTGSHTQLYDWNVDSYTYYSGGYYSDGVTPIDPSIVSPVMSCLGCHGVNGWLTNYPRLHFDAFALGTDLTNDHPIGVQLPDTNVYDFNAPTGTSGALKFFDTNSNGKPDKSEVRFYNTGGGFEVECASCHDPHGVPSAGPGSVFIPSFLRVSNTGSVLCMTCHDK